MPEYHAKVWVTQWLVLHDVFHDLLPGLGVKPQGCILIQECEGVSAHVCHLIIKEVIVVTEFIDHIVRRVLSQMFENLTRRERDELQVEDFQLLVQ